MIGLVCGQTKSKHYTQYIAALASKEDLGKIQNVNYRGKSPEKPASNFYFNSIDERGFQHKIFWNEGVSEAWVNRWFTPNVCNYCDDVFAELADVVFMDAWLPEYSKDSRGTNLVLVRSPEILAYIKEGIQREEISANKIAIEKLIESQAGVLDLKRSKLSYHLYLAKKNGLKVPKKRVQANNKLDIFKKQEIKIRNEMQKASKNIFVANFDENKLSIKKYNEEMKYLIHDAYALNIIRKVMLPLLFVKKFTRIVRSK